MNIRKIDKKYQILLALIMSFSLTFFGFTTVWATSQTVNDFPIRQTYGIIKYAGQKFIGVTDPKSFIQDQNNVTNLINIKNNQIVLLSTEPGRYENIGGMLWYQCKWNDGVDRSAWVSEEYITLVEQLP